MHNYIWRTTKHNINTVSGGTTLLFTTEDNANRRFYPVLVIIEVATLSGLISLPTISIGTNASSYNNIMADTLVTGLNAVNKILSSVMANTAISSVAPNTAVYANVSGLAIATTMTVHIHVLGFYD